MKHEVKVPSAGESVNEAFIGEWKKQNGDYVEKGEVIVDLESQKASFELEAEVSGRLQTLANNEDKVDIGQVIATIDDSVSASEKSEKSITEKTSSNGNETAQHANANLPTSNQGRMGPAARNLSQNLGVNPQNIAGSGPRGTITKEDISRAAHIPSTQAPAPASTPTAQPKSFYTYTVDAARGEKAERASRMRKKIAENLVAAQHTAAILTSFNEVDMSAIMNLRKKYKDKVLEKHNARIGFMGAFGLACARALKTYPIVNSTFTGEEIIKRDFVDISVAVSTEKGLVAPVIRDVQNMSWIDFDNELAALAAKARDGKLSIPEMTGGTFTITNGGVFGSLISTPLLNMPQTAILGMHTIKNRAVVLDDGSIVARPMMYIALSYDHRLIDGKDAVQFLICVKESLEDPSLIIDEKTLG